VQRISFLEGNPMPYLKTNDEVADYTIWAMRSRNRRGNEPYRGNFTPFGTPWCPRWRNHKAQYLNIVKTFRQPEVDMPVCAVGLIWVVGGMAMRDLPMQFHAKRAGLNVWHGAGLIVLNDAGASWGTLASATEAWRKRPCMSGGAVSRDVFRLLRFAKDVKLEPVDLRMGAALMGLLGLPWPAKFMAHMRKGKTNTKQRSLLDEAIDAWPKGKSDALALSAANDNMRVPEVAAA
jgi:hypothetical protein